VRAAARGPCTRNVREHHYQNDLAYLQKKKKLKTLHEGYCGGLLWLLLIDTIAIDRVHNELRV